MQQQFPSTDVPSVQVLLSYPGARRPRCATRSCVRSKISSPGRPTSIYLETSIQPGRRRSSPSFQLTSDQNNDLVQVQGRVQNAQHSLPNDLHDAADLDLQSERSRRRLAGAAFALARARRSLVADRINKIVPSLEQVPGVSYVRERRRSRRRSRSTSTRSALSSLGLHAHRRGQHDHEQQRSRTGRHPLLSRIAKPISTFAATFRRADGRRLAARATDAARARRRRFALPWSASARLFRIGDVANVHRHLRDPARLRVLGRSAVRRRSTSRRSAGTSEVDRLRSGAGGAARAAADRIPNVDFSVLNVQSTYTQAAALGRARTLIEAIVFTGIVMLFFLRSWRNAIVVMIRVPASLLVTLSAMRVAALHARHRFALGDDVDDRYPRRRFDRRSRKYRAPFREGEEPRVAASMD